MLPKLLAIVIATGSSAFYLAAFFVPEVHRKPDFAWSGVGLFYALVLWFCAGQMGSTEILGQTAAVTLLLWLGWQTLLLRRTTTPPQQQTPLRFGSARTAKQRLTVSTRPRMEYEFVEDGVAVADTEADRPQAVTVDPVGTLVVPAAVVAESVGPDRAIEAKVEAQADVIAEGAVSSAAEADWGDDLELDMPIGEAEGAIAPVPPKGPIGNLRNLFKRPKKAPQPMVELPPRPASIPSAGQSSSIQPSAGPPSAGPPSAGSPMLELPPRPPSIPGLGKQKKSGQPMLELPPRPPSIPRPAKNQQTESQEQPENPPVEEPVLGTEDDTVNAPLSAPAPSTQVPPAAPPSPATETADDEDSNWPDDDEDWV